MKKDFLYWRTALRQRSGRRAGDGGRPHLDGAWHPFATSGRKRDTSGSQLVTDSHWPPKTCCLAMAMRPGIMLISTYGVAPTSCGIAGC